MAKSFDQLAKKTMTPDARRRAKARAQELMADMLLAEVRKMAGFTQADLANALGVKQPNVAKMERQDDMQVSTLNRLVHALGGELEIVARMPGGAVRITQFADSDTGTITETRNRAPRR